MRLNPSETTVTDRPTSIHRCLTLDPLRKIFSYLEQPDLMAAGAVCRRWRRAASDDMLWRPLFAESFGFAPCKGVYMLYRGAIAQLRQIEAGNYTLSKGDREAGPVHSAVRTPYGLASGGSSGRLRIEGPIYRDLPGHTGDVHAVCVDGDCLYSSDEHGLIQMWDAAGGVKLGQIQGPETSCYQVRALDKKLYTAWADGSIRIYNLDDVDGSPRVLDGHHNWVFDLAVYGDHIYTVSGDAKVKVWERQTDKLAKTLHGSSGWVFCIQVDSDRIYAGGADGSIRIWNRHTWHLERRLDSRSDWINCIAILGNRLYAGCRDGTLQIWNVDTSTLLREIDLHSGALRGIVINGGQLSVGTEAGGIVTIEALN